MVQKLAVVVLVGCTLALAACNTVRGAATDVNSAASCTENAMHGGKC
ncbi:MAG TPA: entericidin EcnA/B family protein [Sphingomicrobium sp.]|jgi:predicted small secreted protein|nr:entericidin EcnA/B family protein [Sphingomicrobium sp.]